MRALVVFRDFKDSHPLSFLLKKGFHHCFVCIEQDGLWLQIDYGKGKPIVSYLTTDDFDLVQHYKCQGMTVVETHQRGTAPTIPFVLRNCVGMVKQILCIRSLSFTPYSLYKYLTKE